MESVIAIYDEEFKKQNREKRIARLQASKKKESA